MFHPCSVVWYHLLFLCYLIFDFLAMPCRAVAIALSPRKWKTIFSQELHPQYLTFSTQNELQTFFLPIAWFPQITTMHASTLGLLSSPLFYGASTQLCYISLLELSSSSEKIGDIGIKKLFLSKENSTGFVRKLLASPDEGGAMNRIGGTCSKDNIVIFQGPTTPLPSGIPTYTVQILNVCVAGCSISNIHVRCGWFSSARLINPRLFRRIFFDDCLVNNGDALGPGESLSFQYANSFRYPLSVLSVSCF
ncbi:unnamed protein product, partial [Vitis vinifera]